MDSPFSSSEAPSPSEASVSVTIEMVRRLRFPPAGRRRPAFGLTSPARASRELFNMSSGGDAVSGSSWRGSGTSSFLASRARTVVLTSICADIESSRCMIDSRKSASSEMGPTSSISSMFSGV